MANGRFQCLVALERFQVWWPLEGEGKTSFSFFFTSPFNKFYLNLCFSIDLKVLLYYVLNHYFTHFLPFPWPINYNHESQCIKSSTHSSSSWFRLKILSFLWIHSITHDHILWALSRISEGKTTSGVIFKFHIDATSLWRTSRTTRGVPSSWNWTPLSLVLSHFSDLSHLGDFVASRPHFWWWT